MSHHGKLRTDKTCLNCNHQVEERYCPNCGQENTETRKPFHYLFTHFFEDLTHYDGQFWGTIKNLLFKPGKLTNTYLEGKRQTFVPPVKLYIFVSFVTFLLFPFFSTVNYDKKKIEKAQDIVSKSVQTNISKEISKSIEAEKISLKDTTQIAKLEKAQSYFNDSLQGNDLKSGLVNALDPTNKMDDNSVFLGAKSWEEYQKQDHSLSWLRDPVARKYFELKEQGVTKGDIMKNLFSTFFHNLPKALFIYLPIFALFLWIFHDKKKWWYFDHGIFTLHYFSFLLISALVLALIPKIFRFLPDALFINVLLFFIILGILTYCFIYFFIAHKRVYKTHSIFSIFIGGIIFFINYIAFLLLLIFLGLYSFSTMH